MHTCTYTASVYYGYVLLLVTSGLLYSDTISLITTGRITWVQGSPLCMVDVEYDASCLYPGLY